MKGDFSTERFNPSRNYNRVLKQQGRVDLDSDWNEQAAIAQYYQRALIADLVGPAAGPAGNCGFGLVESAANFGVSAVAGDLILGGGRYYVDGLMVENPGLLYYTAQAALPGLQKLTIGKSYSAYLDVWERHITSIEDDTIREVALGGPDTATRVQTVWQVKVAELVPVAADNNAPAPVTLQMQLADAQAKLAAAQAAAEKEAPGPTKDALNKTIAGFQKQIATLQAKIAAGAGPTAPPAPTPTPSPGPAPAPVDCAALLKPQRNWKSGLMIARLTPADPGDTPCVLSPDSRYRGLENQLYRVEVHTSGDTANSAKPPTFKWSRENGSVVTRCLGPDAGGMRVGSTRDFAAGQWVEFTSETDDLLGQPGPLSRVTRVDADLLTVATLPDFPDTLQAPKVRRWDQAANDTLKLVDGAIPIVPATGEVGWIALENGIEVQFSPGTYRSGDYWLITARVVTGKIDWPVDAKGKELALAPRGIVHHYAPLFVFDAIDAAPFVALRKDCRCLFAPLPCIVPAP